MSRCYLHRQFRALSVTAKANTAAADVNAIVCAEGLAPFHLMLLQVFVVVSLIATPAAVYATQMFAPNELALFADA